MDEDCYACSISLPQDGYGIGEIEYHSQVQSGDGGSPTSLASPPHDIQLLVEAQQNINEWYGGDGFGFSGMDYVTHTPTQSNGDGRLA